MTDLYRNVQEKLNNKDATTEAAVQAETIKLHAFDQENINLWNRFVVPSMDSMYEIYKKLNIKFDTQLGESSYNHLLPTTVQKLKQKGIAMESEGALVVMTPQTAPFIIQKSNGDYNYATTDLATLAFRMEKYAPDEILYIVDHRQSDHFKSLFHVSEKLSYKVVLGITSCLPISSMKPLNEPGQLLMILPRVSVKSIANILPKSWVLVPSSMPTSVRTDLPTTSSTGIKPSP